MTCHHVFYILCPVALLIFLFLILELVCAYEYWATYHHQIPEMQYLGFFNEEE